MCIGMEGNTLEIGKRIRRAGMARRDGPMDPDIEACLRMELNSEKDISFGLTEVIFKVNSKMAQYKVLGHIIGVMDALTQVNGPTTR